MTDVALNNITETDLCNWTSEGNRWPLGTIWEKEVPEVVTNEGWIEMRKINISDNALLGIAGKICHGIDEHGRPIPKGTAMSEQVFRNWRRLRA
ncbi:hypothetical protein LCGC14_0403660 [marine sediment metagenome]|uniref:Uncharacterized protein n=1 Tax=marine sediment metagenome TaxID=412755 RepID=A0A0F9W563_9ZZZZ